MAILDHPGTHGSDTRPARNASGRKLWAKDPSGPGAADGTRLDATFINDLVGVLRAVLTEYEITPTAGDDTVLVQAIAAALAPYAPLASPALTGTPTAPTADAGTNTQQLATTAFVKAALDALIAAAPGALDTLDELAAALGDDASFASTMTTALAGKVATADLASQAEAEAGADNTKWMTPLRVAQALAALGGAGVDSFNGRTGAVSPASGDYAIADVTGLQTALDAKAALAGPYFTGGVGLTGEAGSYRLYSALSGGLFRWQWGADNGTETGSDAGSNFQIHTYDDAGAWLRMALEINRASGAWTISGPLQLGGAGTYLRIYNTAAGSNYFNFSEVGGDLYVSDTAGTSSFKVRASGAAAQIKRAGTYYDLLDAYTMPTASQAEAEAGTEAALRAFSPLRVAQAIAALAGGGIKGLQVLTASGTYTRTSGATKALVIAIGGGGGGYGTGVGGGSGEVRMALVTPAETETATIGAAGAIGGTGGATSLGSLITANGGLGNGSGTAGSGGSGGSPLPAGIGAGQDGSGNYGKGGSNLFGEGGVRMSATNYNPTGYGAGGLGDSAGSTAGTAGVLIIIEF